MMRLNPFATSGDYSTTGTSAGWVVGGVVGAVLFSAMGIIICKRKRNTGTMQQETAASGGVETGNVKYDIV
jgi:hypothetical protein